MSFFDVPDLPSPGRVVRVASRLGRAAGGEFARPVRRRAGQVRGVVTKFDKAVFGGEGIQSNLRRLRKELRRRQR